MLVLRICCICGHSFYFCPNYFFKLFQIYTFCRFRSTIKRFYLALFSIILLILPGVARDSVLSSDSLPLSTFAFLKSGSLTRLNPICF